MKETFSFFGRSKRINAVIFNGSTISEVGSGFAWIIHSQRYVNAGARHPINTDFLFMHGNGIDERLIQLLRNAENLEGYLHEKTNDDPLADNDFSFLSWARTNASAET
jgi:hypothetical protein